jgi:hypothetical protein
MAQQSEKRQVECEKPAAMTCSLPRRGNVVSALLVVAGQSRGTSWTDNACQPTHEAQRSGAAL